jgi:integrase
VTGRQSSDNRHVESFLEMLVAERGAAANTYDAYGRDLKDFAGFLARRGRAVHRAGVADLRAYLGHLTDAGLAPRSAARRLSTLRQFHRFLFGEGLRADDPTAGLDSPRQGRALPKVLSEAEVEGLLAAARARPGAEGVRLTALLELLYATGLRVSELVELPAAATARDPRVLIVKGKGGKERMIPLSEPARDALKAHRMAELGKSGGGAGAGWRPASTPPRSRPTCCATPSPATCSTTAPICARYRRCSVMPTSRPPRSTPTCSTPASRRWSVTTIRCRTPRVRSFDIELF